MNCILNQLTSRLRTDGFGSGCLPSPSDTALQDAGLTESFEPDNDLAQATNWSEQSDRGKFVVSIVGRCKRRMLHKVGECFRLPGVHYQNFEMHTDTWPDRRMYHLVCKDCFRNVNRLGDIEHSDSSDSESSSSSEA